MSGVLLWVNCGLKENAISLMGLGGRDVRTQRRFRHCSGISFASFSSAVVEPTRSSEERVYEVVLKQAALVKEQRKDIKKRGLNLDDKPIEGDFTNGELLSSAYDRCGDVCAEYAKTFYLGTTFLSLFCISHSYCILFNEYFFGHLFSSLYFSCLQRNFSH